MRAVGVAAIAGLAVALPVQAQERVAANLVTHSTVTIDRPASAVWPHIVDPSGWKQGAKLRHHGGPEGEVGAVFAAYLPGDSSRIVFLVEEVERVPNERRTIKLYLTSGTLLGFATWWLREDNGRTVVGYDVYSETPVPVPTKPEQVRAAERAERLANQQRFDEELRALKRLVEKGG
jgi:hypothetical protein